MCVVWIDLFHVVGNVAALGLELLKAQSRMDSLSV